MIAIRWHLFPADVAHNGQQWHEVLVQLTDAAVLYVWTYDPATRDPVQLLTAPVTAGLEAPLPSPWGPGYLIDETWNTAGGPVRITKASGCGCRNPLRDANPLAGVNV